MLNKMLMIFLVGLLTLSAVCAADNSTGDFTNTQISAVEDNSTVDVSNFENDEILSDEEGWIDATEAYECVNEYRAEKGVWYWNYDDVTITYFNTNDDNQLRPYVRDAALEQTAKIRAKELSEYFAHDRPDGTSCYTAFPDGLIGMGECISWASTGREAVETWKEDPFFYEGQGHRRAQLSPDLNCIGIGAYRAANGMIFWAQSLGIREIYMDNKTSSQNLTPLNPSKKTFADLNMLIQNGSDITLQSDYVYWNDSSLIDGILIEKSLTIDGLGHTIDANDKARIFNITADNVLLKNINFANGFSSYGHGAIYAQGCNLTLLNCSFNSNSAYYGAALSSNGGNATLFGCSFNDNFAVEGSLYSSNADISLINCSFSNNSAILYGTVTSFNAGISIEDCIFKDNANYKGGALYLSNCSASITSCDFKNNSAIYDGGALYLASSNTTIENSTFAGNFIGAEKFANEGGISARGDYSNGGTIFSSEGIISLSGCSFENNAIYANYAANGGCLYSRNVIVSVQNSSFRNSHLHSRISSCQGGALYLVGGNVSVKGCSFNNNSVNNWGGSAIFLIENQGSSVADCTFNDNKGSSALDFRYAEGVVSNCSFTDNEGGIFSRESSVSIFNSNFTHNLALEGGGMYSDHGNFSLIGCAFEDNDASSNGGAIYSIYSNASVSGCGFTKNHAVFGGAIYLNYNNLTFSGNTFTNNDAVGGGAVYGDNGDVTLSDSVFSKNTAIDGGATFNCNAVNCTFTQNFASSTAGAMYGRNNTAYGCRFIKNRAVSNSPNYAVITDACTFEANGLVKYAYFLYQYVDSQYYQGDLLYLYLYDSTNSDWVSNATVTIRAYKNDELVSTFNCSIDYGWSVDIAPGTYLFKFDVENQDYIVDGIEKSVEILERKYAEANVTVENVTFPEAVTVTITSTTSGLADVYVDDVYFDYFDLTSNTTSQFILSYLSAGDHMLSVTINSLDSVIYPKTYKMNFTISKKPTSIALNVENTTDAEAVVVKLTSSDHGNANIRIGDVEKSVYLIAGVETQVVFDALEWGTYAAVCVFEGDDNYAESNASMAFKVFKQVKSDEIIVSQNESNITVTLPKDLTGSIKFTIAGESRIIDVVNGIASVGNLNLDDGAYQYEITYAGDGKYAGFTVTDNIVIQSAQSSKTVPNMEVSEFVGGIARTTLPNDATGSVTLTINGRNYTFDVAGGSAEIRLPDLDDDEYSYEITYSGDDRYLPFATIGVVNIENTPHALLIPDVKIPDLNDGLDVGYVILSVPDDVKATVKLSVSGNTYVFDVADGKSMVILPDLANGNYDYSITYCPLSKYANYTDIGILRVNRTGSSSDVKQVPEITIPPLDSPSADGSVVVTLPGDATGTVLLTIGGRDYSFDVVNGRANVVVPDLADGNYQYTITYSGDGKYSSVTSEGSLNKVSPVIVAKNTNVLYTANAKYSVTVYGSDGKIAENALVTFKINGKEVGRAYSDANGVATYTVKNVPGTYNIVASALGCSVTNKLTVKHLVTLKSVTVKKSAKKLVLTATLGKINNKYLKNKPVTFKFNGKTYKAKTNSKGVAKVTIKSNVLKKLKVGKKLTYQATYLKDTVKKTVKIKK